MIQQSRFTTLTFIVATLLLTACSQAPVNKPASATSAFPETKDSNDGTHSYTLKNGLKLIVREDHRSPVVVSQVWYKIGSSYEHSGKTGISHLLEHMMFKGTAKHPAGEFSRIISANGGRENAFTGRDYTAYFQQLERSRLKVSFELEADRMRQLQLPAKEFTKEQQVVIEERRMRTDDNPQSLTQELFNATAYVNSGYHNPVIGWMDDIKGLSQQALSLWYHRWYSPNNATLVVAGDVHPQDVLKLAKQYFGGLRNTTMPLPPQARKEVRQRGLRRSIVKAPAKLPYLLMGYKVPVIKDDPSSWEPYALEVLAGILSGGDSARLSSRLIRGSQIAANADVGYDPYARQRELFVIDGTPSKGHSTAELEAALRAEIAQLQETLVSESELARIKAQVVAEDVYQKDSVFYQAMEIGMLETIGLDWRIAKKYVPRVRAISAAQVRKVARKYLLDDQLTITELQPLPLHKEPAPALSMHSLNKH